jgi:hypothetical protein
MVVDLRRLWTVGKPAVRTPEPRWSWPACRVPGARKGRRQPTGVVTTTADEADAGLTQLLRLPPVRAQSEQVTPGRQGGLAVAAMGAVLTVIGVLFGLAQPDAGAAWAGLPLIGLGTVEIAIGMILVALARLDRQPPVGGAYDESVLTEPHGRITAARESSGDRGSP